MAVALETVVKQLEDSGIVAPGKLENFVPPKAHPTSVEALVAELVKENHLTKFQAAQVAAGRSKSLILGSYTILDKIGAGGMGQVFKAEHRRMKRLVAIKMLPTAMMKDAAASARFQREVEAAAKLSHPNIVAAHDAAEANGVHFLVMEYVEGQDLSALVKKNGPFPVAKAVNFVLQAARGLEFAHAEGVVHRDIKPANLLLDKKGTVKILDMGLARIETGGNAATQAELTGTGAIMGTVDYMAPEQGMSTKHADARADIYSLGCSLYYLIAGKATYDGETVAAKLVAHHTHPIPVLRLARPEVSEQVESIFKRMVAKKIEDRYQSVTEVIADLERLRANSGTVNDPYGETAALNSGALAAFNGIDVSRTTARTAATKQAAGTKSRGGKRPPWVNVKVLVGAGGAGLALLLGVILIVRDKDNKEVARIDAADGTKVTLPAGGSVQVQSSASQTTPKATTAASAKLFMHDPAFQQWVKAVQAMPAGEQIQAVRKKLMELNPGFDGTVTASDGKGAPRVENGAVTDLKFTTNNVTDISPIRALVSLKQLDCSASAGKGILSDLAPLTGMKLTKLSCIENKQIENIYPLLGMPLTFFNGSRTNISDLTPLKGSPLTELTFTYTAVTDMSPLSGMTITNLNCGGTAVSDLRPLKNIPLKHLNCSYSQVSDLSPLVLNQAYAGPLFLTGA